MRRALVLAALSAAPITAAPSFAGPLAPVPSVRPGSLSSIGGGRVEAEIVKIKTADDQTLEASFFKPEKPQSPAVVLVHDAGADRSQLLAIAERLHKQKFGVLAIDLRGHGGSKSAKFDWAQMSAEEQKATWSYGVRDIDAASDWLLEQPNIQKTKLVLVGYGSGCALIARHAKNDEKVACLVLFLPKPEDYGFDVKADIQTLEGLPTCVVAMKNDEAERMVIAANLQAGDNPPIQLMASTPKNASLLLDDKKIQANVASWIGDVTAPKKGQTK